MKSDDKEWQHCRVEKMGCKGCYYDEIKIMAYNVQHLKRQIHGRKDCIIYIPYSCSKEIEKMDYSDYLELEENLKARNIKLKVEEQQ